MPTHSFASRLAALLILAFAGSVFGAGKMYRGSKSRNPHRSAAQDETENATPPASGAPPGAGQHEGVTTKASLETSGYRDSDHVYVGSPSFGASFSDEVAGWSVGGHYLVDVVSAASVDIVSTASSKWLEVRHVGSADGSFKVNDVSVSGSGSFSREPDYLSLSAGGTVTVDLLEKNVTPFVSFSYGDDEVGRTELPRDFWRKKKTLSGRVGVTFVVDRATIASVQVDAISESGFLSKPYRFIPLFAPGTGGLTKPGISVNEVNARRVDQRPIEQLPELRNRFALTGRVAHRYASSTIRVDERAYADTWGVRASTTDFRYVADIGQRWELWPHLRFHVQGGATFWQRAYELVPGQSGTLGVPEIRTGDRELSALYTATVGFGTRFKLIDDLHKPWFVVLEGDFGFTKYLDALYISERNAIFTTLGIEAEF